MEMSRTASPAGVAKRTKVRYTILLLIFSSRRSTTPTARRSR